LKGYPVGEESEGGGGYLDNDGDDNDEDDDNDDDNDGDNDDDNDVHLNGSATKEL
jgi:hypothetical protein